MEVRIDSFLWAVRVFKSRSIASDACKKGRVTLNGQLVKPARLVAVGDLIGVRKAPVTYTFKVLQVAKNRMGAKLVPEYVLNVTPKEEYEVLELKRVAGFIDRAKGEGRPTKKDRRSLDEWQDMHDSFSFLDDDFFELEDDE
ncbi:heat-shock protein Hsp15 [Porphyromonas gingivicanis]|uniref:Heat-shock protein Hsp15 n=1 Tax=Porphyromonas gingivicanis TaxID=266762 RepID=A0A0A2G6T7_9PORP|nr:RNA-binding S4 domain-containing protein [Porphyromonas gingivicanis]KGN98983.1 heat-shock protein Hsp15 [Porphyromonas gingivicanis]